jgi:hypothetical protein
LNRNVETLSANHFCMISAALAAASPMAKAQREESATKLEQTAMK